MRRLTTWHKPSAPTVPWEGLELVEVDPRYVPTIIRDLEPRKVRSMYPSDEAFATGYDALCKQQEALLMGIGTQLVREIRAGRGIDELDPGYDDPAVDPFTLRMGTVEKVAQQLEGVNAKLDQVLIALNNQQSPEELAEIVGQLGQIATLLA